MEKGTETNLKSPFPIFNLFLVLEKFAVKLPNYFKQLPRNRHYAIGLVAFHSLKVLARNTTHRVHSYTLREKNNEKRRLVVGCEQDSTPQ